MQLPESDSLMGLDGQQVVTINVHNGCQLQVPLQKGKDKVGKRENFFQKDKTKNTFGV